jgi:hypothetical protein
VEVSGGAHVGKVLSSVAIETVFQPGSVSVHAGGADFAIGFFVMLGLSNGVVREVLSADALDAPNSSGLLSVLARCAD